jgi:hypothetical protein
MAVGAAEATGSSKRITSPWGSFLALTHRVRGTSSSRAVVQGVAEFLAAEVAGELVWV